MAVFKNCPIGFFVSFLSALVPGRFLWQPWCELTCSEVRRWHLTWISCKTWPSVHVVYSFICNVDDQNKTVKTTSRSWVSSCLASNFEVQEGNKISWRNRKFPVTRKLVCQDRKYLSLVLVFAAGFVLVTYFAFFWVSLTLLGFSSPKHVR